MCKTFADMAKTALFGAKHTWKICWH